ncbi:MAG TPA: thiamine pyrophosphate-dependent dehydrogenase E1 component subunit alpha [Thermoanaerobaculia bacterium]|nr:thiamine pyrophosphate-dependent dehydrogenase E1 component subunit alpha [Thermoanaerobaculia bacterium]
MADPTREQRIAVYRHMRTTRLVEEKLVHLYRQGKIVGGLYRCLGQEATAVGSAFALSKGDILGPLIRNLGSVLVMGFTPRDVFAQHMGKASAPSGGKDGNLHLGTPEQGVVSAISMLGALVPVMAGIALAARMQRRPIVAMTYIGDGGTSTGPFHEGMNFAGVERLPLVVVAENNGWAYSTPFRKQTAARSLADRATAYGVPADSVDGNDVLAVYEACRRAVERARRGEGPTLVEAKTYRMKGHAEHDNQEYVPKQELEAWIRRDPIEAFARALLESGLATRQDLAAIDREASVLVERDADLADKSPFPAPERALEGVYAVASETPSEVAAGRAAS